jgi:hypothetical protein
VFNGQTASSYAFTTPFPEPKLSHEQTAEHAETNSDTIKDLVESFDVASFFGHALNLEEDAANVELDSDFSYTLYISERDINSPN